MTNDVLTRLAEADPAQHFDPAPDEDLLARTLATPRAPTSRESSAVRRRLRVPAVAVIFAAAAVVAVALLGISRGPDSLALAARAYAQTSAGPGEIVYTLATSVRTNNLTGTLERETGTIEEWHRGTETHRLETYVSQHGTRTALDHVIDAAGVMRQVDAGGRYRIIRPSDNKDAANAIAQQQAGFIQEFRRRYERGELDPAGDVQFAGRPARRYIVAATPAAGPQPPSPQQAFYVDRDSGAPLGYTSDLQLPGGAGNSATPQARSFRVVETVRTIRRLTPTPENLRKLRTLTLPRRRDANGCIRGPVTNARNSDTAAKRDCGGTPGAKLPS